MRVVDFDWVAEQEREAFALLNQDPERAAGIFQALLERWPGNLRSMRGYARLLMKRGDYDTARPYWERIAELDPDTAEPYLGMARIHRRDGRVVEAIAAAAQALKLEPDHERAQALYQAIAEQALEQLAAEISPERASGLRHRLAELEAILGDHPLLLRLKTFTEYAQPPSARAGARNAVAAEDLSPDADAQLLRERAEEHAGNQDWAGFLSSAEELFWTTGPDEETVEFLNRYHEQLKRLAGEGEAGIGTKAARLMTFVTANTQPDTAARLDGKGGAADVGAIVESMELMAQYADDPVIGRRLEEQVARLLGRFAARRSALSGLETEAVDATLQRIVEASPKLAGHVARFYVAGGEGKRALAFYRRLSEAEVDYQTWLEAAKLASAANDADAVAEFCQSAVSASRSSAAVIAAVTLILMNHKLYDAAIAAWRAAEGYRLDFKARLGVIRAMAAARQDAALVEEALGVLTDASPVDRLSVREQTHLVEIVRRLTQACTRAELGEKLKPHEAVMAEHNPPSALSAWIRGSLASARFDLEAARRHFEEGLSMAPLPRGLAVDLNAEIVLLYARYHLFQEADHWARHVPTGLLSTNDYYRRNLQLFERVRKAYGDQALPHYPEFLIDIILDEIAAEPITYQPRTREVLVISSSLAQGGGERQTITVLQKMLKDPRLDKISLLVRSVEREDGRFFLPLATELPVNLTIYGEDWSRRSDLAAEVPKLAARRRLAAALDLLPHSLREEIIRLCKLFFAHKPKAVHLRQDLYSGALACAIAGVPHYLIHRGSLSPDLWEYNPLQSQVHLRPMRHTYRRLLERPNFTIVNNSSIGSGTDRTWLGWDDPKPFQVIHNVVDFEQLGPQPRPQSQLA